MKFKTPLDESQERFKIQHNIIKQRKIEDQARYKAIEKIVHKKYQEKRENSAEKIVQAGEDDTIKKMKEQEALSKEQEGGVNDEKKEEVEVAESEKARKYKEMLR